MKKRISFAFNHLQYSDGVARAAIGIANLLSERDDIQVILRPIYHVDKSVMSILASNVVVKPVLGFYFSGMSRILNRLPGALLHKLVFGMKESDIEIGFQHGTATRAVVSGTKKNAYRMVWVHGYDERLTLRKYYLRADKVVCVSKSNADKLKHDLGMGAANSRVDYCYNPIDNHEVEKLGKESADLPAYSGVRMITVGRLSPEKGYLRLLHALSRLKHEGFLFQMIFVGDGPQKEELLQCTKDMGLSECVIFAGAQSNPHKYTAKADVFICSSFAEGYSTSCTEAVMLGVPVVSTQVSGAEEIIESAESGLVVENTEDGLYENLKKILEDPEVICRWKETLQNSKYNFSVEKRSLKLKELLEI